jgi:hypothetical protein
MLTISNTPSSIPIKLWNSNGITNHQLAICILQGNQWHAALASVVKKRKEKKSYINTVKLGYSNIGFCDSLSIA